MKTILATLYILIAVAAVCTIYEIGYVNGALCELTRVPGVRC